MEGRVIPRDIEAEYGVLSSMLVDERASGTAFEQLTKEDFYDNNNGLIYEAMELLEIEGVPIDILTLSDKLSQMGVLNDIGGINFLAELSAKSGYAGSIQFYVNIVKHKSLMRKLIDYSRRLSDRAFLAEDDEAEIIDYAESELYKIQEGKDTDKLTRLNKVLIETFKILEERSLTKGNLSGLSTGYQDLDYYLKGLQKQDLIIIAARPSMGKTALAVNIAVNAAKNSNASCVIFSLEMAKEQLSQRMLAFTGQIQMDKLMGGNLQDSDWQDLLEASAILGDVDIFIDNSARNLTAMKSKCRTLKAEGKLDLVVIDYLQQMEGELRSENRQQEISKISRGLKLMAMELDCPVIALSQLSRAPDSRADKRPLLSDLRESGAIEQDADVVMLLYREDYYDNETEAKGITEINIAKHRNGPVATVKLLFKKEFTRFISLGREDQNV